MGALEFVTGRRPANGIAAAVFDFDGTISTLRCGWETVMRPLMLEMITGGGEPDEALVREVDDYIDASTGIQTVYQMQWLADRVVLAGGDRRDAWFYKDEYNRRLMEKVAEKKRAVETGAAPKDDYRIAGAVAFLDALRAAGVRLYLASGTDHRDVVKEAALLGVADRFDVIAGAPERMAACSKEAVLKMLFEEQALPADRLLVVGDGKVEIALGRAAGAYTLGAATDEAALHGVNEIKRRRLLAAGADAICGDFSALDELLSWLTR